jgi:hypothetical protein
METEQELVFAILTPCQKSLNFLICLSAPTGKVS